MTICILGIRDEATGRSDLVGVYDERVAVIMCLDDRYFVAPLVINKRFPATYEEWPGCYYPKLTPKTMRQKRISMDREIQDLEERLR